MPREENKEDQNSQENRGIEKGGRPEREVSAESRRTTLGETARRNQRAKLLRQKNRSRSLKKS